MLQHNMPCGSRQVGILHQNHCLIHSHRPETCGKSPSINFHITVSDDSGDKPMKLTDFKALSFDCYGTLIDWETGMIEGLKNLTSRVERDLSRDDILEAHARHESSQQSWTPAMRYRDLLPIVYKRLAEEWGVSFTSQECSAYGRSVENWPAFKDSAEALEYLKKHYKLVILSNVDNESFKGSNNRLQVEFDAIYTAEDVGSYKPSDRNFDYMLEKLKTMWLYSIIMRSRYVRVSNAYWMKLVRMAFALLLLQQPPRKM